MFYQAKLSTQLVSRYPTDSKFRSYDIDYDIETNVSVCISNVKVLIFKTKSKPSLF